MLCLPVSLEPPQFARAAGEAQSRNAPTVPRLWLTSPGGGGVHCLLHQEADMKMAKAILFSHLGCWDK